MILLKVVYLLTWVVTAGAFAELYRIFLQEHFVTADPYQETVEPHQQLLAVHAGPCRPRIHGRYEPREF